MSPSFNSSSVSRVAGSHWYSPAFVRSIAFCGALVSAVLMPTLNSARGQQPGVSPGEIINQKTERSNKNPPAEGPDFGFWDSSSGINVAASVQLTTARSPLTIALLRLAYSNEPLLWDYWTLEITRPLPLHTKWLHDLEDGAPVPNMQDAVPFRERKAHERAYILLFSQALLFSSMTPVEAFAREAGENANVTLVHLLKQPGVYRGKAVTVNGTLRWTRIWDAPFRLQQEGIKKIYEAGIVGPTRGAPPFIAVFVDLPDWLKVGEKQSYQVTFHGYFLQNVKHIEGKTEKINPLFIGRSIIRDSTPVADGEQPYSRSLLIGALVGLACVVTLLILMSLWFRSGDKTVHRRLENWREKRELESLDNVEKGVEDLPIAQPAPEKPVDDRDSPPRRPLND